MTHTRPPQFWLLVRLSFMTIAVWPLHSSAQTNCNTNTALRHLGLTPEVLAVAGFSAAEATQIRDALEASSELNSYMQRLNTLSEAIDAFTAAKEAAKDADRHEDTLSALTVATDNYDVAKAEFDVAVDAIEGLVTTTMTPTDAAEVERIGALATKGVPLKYTRLQFTDQEIESIAVAASFGTQIDVPDWASQILDGYENDVVVVQTVDDLSTIAPAIASVFACE